MEKQEKKLLKDAKKAEKLAKLQMKQQDTRAKPESKPRPKTPNKGYDPTDVEALWVKYWKDNECFKAENSIQSSEKKKFCMLIPPPNITGSLHIGHAMMVAIEDSIVRYKRLNGHEVLYLPGLDHAGISTQAVVLKSTGPVDRDTFMKAAFEWSDKYKDRICEQMDRMGASLDYTRKTFTLDPKVSRSVNEAFVELYNRGLVYRDKKIVNWSGKLRTTLSDLEVTYRDVKGGS